MKKITVVTATRAEYGLLKPLILRLREEPDFQVSVVATGAHLSAEFGSTYREIENDGIPIAKKIDILLSGDSRAAVSKSMALAMIGFADYFEEAKPDLLVVLGDRYELLAVCGAAMNAGVPIAHLCGGETTEGAADEAVRHAITKMSLFHFTTTAAYRRRVIQLGEDPARVFNVGSLSVENILELRPLSDKELSEALGVPIDGRFVLVTFHPVTLEFDTAAAQAAELVAAMEAHPELTFFVTKANADAGGRAVNDVFAEAARTRAHIRLYASLGARCYLSAMRRCAMVLGNSSSGIGEAPVFGVPTVNIGDRQKGRIRARSIIDCAPERASILAAMDLALSLEFRESLRDMENPYGDGTTSRCIVEILKKRLGETAELKKTFYDIDFEG